MTVATRLIREVVVGASVNPCSKRTVKTHLGHLFEKLGVTSRTEAVKIATRRGLVRLN
jgi:DNA-binding NarL/FixJ family response regulator